MRFNFTRPLLLLAVAFAAYQLTFLLMTLFGGSKEDADNIAFAAMLVAALITYNRMNKNRRKRL